MTEACETPAGRDELLLVRVGLGFGTAAKYLEAAAYPDERELIPTGPPTSPIALSRGRGKAALQGHRTW
jgi:hypothetical protein